jgi:hypothetical protein
MSTYPKPPASPDLSLPSIGYTAQPKMSPAIVDPSAFSDVSQKALSDQERDAERGARMSSKLNEIKQRFNWTTDKAWNYLVNVLRDKDFQVEVEESPEPVGASLAQHQEIVRHHVTAQLAELDAELRREYPGLSPEDRMALSQQRDPELHRYARAIEDGSAWQIKPKPVYQFNPDKLAGVLSKYGKQRIEAAPKHSEPEDQEPFLVYAQAVKLT